MNDPAPVTVERYLNTATRLLLPPVARSVRAELHGNLYQDMLDARTQGQSEAQAWETALRKAGPAWSTALSLARVHTLGFFLRVVLLGSALGGASYAV